MYDTLKSTKRQPKNVSPVKKLRNEGWVPGVIYGKSMDSLMIQVELKELKKFFTAHKVKVFEVDVAGDKNHLVSLDKVEKDPIGQEVLHVSFHHLERGVETSVMIPLVMTGEAVGTKSGGVITQMMKEVSCTGKPADLPESIIVDCSDLDVSHHISLKDITAPKGIKFTLTDNEQLLFSCSVPKVQVIEKTTTEEVVPTEGHTDIDATPTEDDKEVA